MLDISPYVTVILDVFPLLYATYMTIIVSILFFPFISYTVYYHKVMMMIICERKFSLFSMVISVISLLSLLAQHIIIYIYKYILYVYLFMYLNS